MNKQQIAILAGLGLAVICALCFGIYIVTSNKARHDTTLPTPRPTSTPTPTPKPTAPPFGEIRLRKGDMTDAQWDNYRQSLTGSIVQWFGWVEEVHEPKNGYCKVAIDMDPPDAFLSVSDVYFEFPEYMALQFQKDQLIAFSGQIKSVGTFLGAMDIDLIRGTIELLPLPTPIPMPTPTR